MGALLEEMAIKNLGRGGGRSMQNVLARTTETDFNNKRIDPSKWSLFWAGMVKDDGPFQYRTGQMENHSRLSHPPPKIHIVFQTPVRFSSTITEGF